jgi:hypothetical protein
LGDHAIRKQIPAQPLCGVRQSDASLAIAAEDDGPWEQPMGLRGVSQRFEETGKHLRLDGAMLSKRIPKFSFDATQGCPFG